MAMRFAKGVALLFVIVVVIQLAIGRPFFWYEDVMFGLTVGATVRLIERLREDS